MCEPPIGYPQFWDDMKDCETGRQQVSEPRCSSDSEKRRFREMDRRDYGSQSGPGVRVRVGWSPSAWDDQDGHPGMAKHALGVRPKQPSASSGHPVCTDNEHVSLLACGDVTEHGARGSADHEGLGVSVVGG